MSDHAGTAGAASFFLPTLDSRLDKLRSQVRARLRHGISKSDPEPGSNPRPKMSRGHRRRLFGKKVIEIRIALFPDSGVED